MQKRNGAGMPEKIKTNFQSESFYVSSPSPPQPSRQTSTGFDKLQSLLSSTTTALTSQTTTTNSVTTQQIKSETTQQISFQSNGNSPTRTSFTPSEMIIPEIAASFDEEDEDDRPKQHPTGEVDYDDEGI